MLHPKTLRRARRSTRSTFAPRTAAFALTLGLVALTGLGSAIPAVAATSATIAAANTTTQDAGAATLREIADEAQNTLDGARAALVASAMVTSDIAASGLDVGVDETTVDTTALREAIEKLSELDVVPSLLLPGVTAEAATQTQRVLSRTAVLRAALDTAEEKKAAEEAAALAQKAAEEAAAQAQQAAEEAAAQAQAEAQAAAASLATSGTPAAAQAIAQQMAAANYGWGGDQFSCLVSLWNKESGWNYQAYNASSGATGIPQALPGSKMASAGADWQTNPATQIAWGLQYISAVYGSPCSAWSHSQSVGWY